MRRLVALCLGLLLAGCAVQVPPIHGIVWQPDNEHVQPSGNWEALGVRRLLVQWTAVDDLAFVEAPGMQRAPKLPDWAGIGRAPWASEVVVGLAGRFQEAEARANLARLAEQSVQLAKVRLPLNVVGWYFPVEIDPGWAEARALAPLLAQMPRPLWISVYDSANVGPEELAETLAAWLPKDVGVLFQDGVGVHAREAFVARHYVHVLGRKFGRERVQVIAEAFRPRPGGGFRAATAEELRPQLAHYDGFAIYLFEARYVTPALVGDIAARP